MIPNEHLARAARLENVDAARELHYTIDPPVFADATVRGLRNLGNTCYGNALLFAFAKMPAVRRWLREHQDLALKPPIHGPRCPLCMLARDVTELTRARARTSVHVPELLFHRATWNADFDNFAQQDAHDAFQSLMDQCDEVDASALRALPVYRALTARDFRESAARASTPCNQIFGNLQRVRVTCQACNVGRELYERAHAHMLSLARVEHNDLGLLFTDHLGEEPLDADFRCENRLCRAQGRGVKTTEVLLWPPVLVVTLKRFEFSRRTLRHEKIDRAIRYPMLFPIRDDVTYNLRAIIVHGGVAGAGHYVAYVRAQNELWYLCNDSAAPTVVADPSEVLRKQAYMLFYER